MLTILISMFIMPFLKNFKLSHILISSILILTISSNLIMNNSLNIPLIDMMFYSDSLSIMLSILSIWIMIMMVMLSNSILLNKTSKKLFIPTASILTIILVMSFNTPNYMSFYILFEASLIPTLLMIILWGYQPERLMAGFFLMIYTVASSLPLLLIMIKLFNKQNSFSMINFISPFNFSNFESMLYLFLILAFMVKLPLFLFHMWLPKAHVEAPLAGSMVLAAILLKLGAFGILRLSFSLPFIMYPNLKKFLIISLLGALATSMICVRQTDLKALIAYSSVSHMGTMMAAICVFDQNSWDASIIMLCAHGFSSSLLFALAANSYQISNSRSLILTKGLMKLIPLLSLFWFLGAMMSMGAPPFISLPAEIFISKAVIFNNLFTMIPFSIIIILSALYSLILFTSTSHGPLMNFSKKFSLLTFNQSTAYLFHSIPPIFFILIMKSFYL